MKFCSSCDNMLFTDIGENKQLIFYCKNCNFREETEKKSQLVFDDNKVSDVMNYSLFLNDHIKHDSTLPHVNNIACTYKDCSKEKKDVIYMKYNFVDMNYLYFCCNCDRFFKSSKN